MTTRISSSGIIVLSLPQNISGVDDYETSDYEADTGRPTGAGRRPDQEGNDHGDVNKEDGADDNAMMMIKVGDQAKRVLIYY